MIREEAIEQLQYCKGLIKRNGQVYLDERDFPLLDMAIEALQTIHNCDQCEWCCPSDGIPTIHVVRCKECKHRSDGGWCDVYIQPRMETDFCNHGERQCNYFGERREP